MEKQIDKLESKIDKIDERLDKIDVHLAAYNEQLKIHIKRSETLEEELKPIKSHVTLMNNLAKIIVFLGVLAGIYSALK